MTCWLGLMIGLRLVVIESNLITPTPVIAIVIVIELSWRKVIVIVIDTLSNCNYSVTFPITFEMQIE